jgi:hypothetical protein
MQCKDIPDLPILKFLAKLDRWATHYDSNPERGMPSVGTVMPAEAPIKLRAAKMAMLIRRGLVEGCTCGCRGDFEITSKGRTILQQTLALPEPAYA